MMSTYIRNPFNDDLYDLSDSSAAVHVIILVSIIIAAFKISDMHASSSEVYLLTRPIMTPGLSAFSTLIADLPIK